MAAPRKIFRIEETQAVRLLAEGAEAAQRHTEIMQAFDALRAALAAPAAAAANPALSGEATGRLASELNLIANRLADSENGNGAETVPLSRIAGELLAVTSGTEQATQKILAAAEQIDQLADNLSAALTGRIEQGPAQDIRDLVIRIFEACNFQDLIGQRINKVMSTMKFVEEHITGVLDEIKNMSSRSSAEGAQYLHGPRLDGDSGHASQVDIDAIFDT
ncbi:MAG TPA: chemotaxis protein [Xanthobacteraceae bacterium]|nr:chemotaxis protein [Xanthobacteraceae bacterium]